MRGIRRIGQGVCGLCLLGATAVQADTEPLAAYGAIGDGGAERVLARLRDLPRAQGTPARPAAEREDALTKRAPVDFITTRPFGSPGVRHQDQSGLTVLWEGRLQWRSGAQWGIELTSIRNPEALDPAAAGLRRF